MVSCQILCTFHRILKESTHSKLTSTQGTGKSECSAGTPDAVFYKSVVFFEYVAHTLNSGMESARLQPGDLIGVNRFCATCFFDS